MAEQPQQVRVDPMAVVRHLEQVIARMAHDYAVVAAQLDAAVAALELHDQERAERVAATTDSDHGE